MDYLAEIITGKEKKLKCSGYMSGAKHDVTEYQLNIGKYWWSFGCPVCGFGSGGSLTEEDHKKLHNLTVNTL